MRYWALISCCFACQSALAQDILPRNDAGRIEERIKEPLQQSSPSTNVEIPFLDGLEDIYPPTADTANIVFRVDQILLAPSSVFSAEQLQMLIKDAIGETITLEDLHQVAANITRLYREEGYAFSRAFIPPQKLSNNTVQIEIIEGTISRVEYRGMAISEDSAIHRYASRIAGQRPVSQAFLERQILLINDLPGVSARVLAEPVKGNPGMMNLVLLIDQHQHELSVSVNNRGTDSIGPYQVVTLYRANNVTDLGEQTSFIQLSTPGNNELRYYSFAQQWPIGGEGLQLKYHYRQSDARPGGVSRNLDLESRSHSAYVGMSYPIIRSRMEDWFVEGGFDWRNSATDSFGAEIIDDRLRYLRAETRYRLIHDAGVSEAKANLSVGLDVLGTTTDAHLDISRAGGSGDASKLDASFKRIQPLDEDWLLTLTASGQWAIDPLLSSELFGLGGTEYGRAFDFSTITGDSGYAASVEISHPLPLQSELIGAANAYGFMDGGGAYDRTETVSSRWQYLSSAGMGAALQILDQGSLRVELAKPITSVDGVNHRLQGFTTLSWSLRF